MTACSDGAPAGPSAQELLRRAAEATGRAQSAVERIDVEQADGIQRTSVKVSWASPEIRADLGGGVRVVEGAAYQDASWAGLKWVRIDGPEGRPANARADRAASSNTAGGFLRLRRQLNPVTVLTGAGGDLVKRAETEDTSQGPRTTTTTYLDLGVTADVQAPPASDLSSYQEMLQHAIHP